MTSEPQNPMYIVNVEVAVWRAGRYLAITRAAGESVGAGDIAFPGGKVDLAIPVPDILEATARREVWEEVGLTLGDQILYVESHTFGSDTFPVLDIVMLAQTDDIELTLAPEEVERADWLTYDAMMTHPAVQPWTRESLRRAEQLRQSLDWS